MQKDNAIVSPYATFEFFEGKNVGEHVERSDICHSQPCNPYRHDCVPMGPAQCCVARTPRALFLRENSTRVPSLGCPGANALAPFTNAQTAWLKPKAWSVGLLQAVAQIAGMACLFAFVQSAFCLVDLSICSVFWISMGLCTCLVCFPG